MQESDDVRNDYDSLYYCPSVEERFYWLSGTDVVWRQDLEDYSDMERISKHCWRDPKKITYQIIESSTVDLCVDSTDIYWHEIFIYWTSSTDRVDLNLLIISLLSHFTLRDFINYCYIVDVTTSVFPTYFRVIRPLIPGTYCTDNYLGRSSQF